MHPKEKILAGVFILIGTALWCHLYTIQFHPGPAHLENIQNWGPANQAEAICDLITLCTYYIGNRLIIIGVKESKR